MKVCENKRSHKYMKVSENKRSHSITISNNYNFIKSLLGMRDSSNSPNHMTNMATMLIHGKSLYISSSLRPVDQWPRNLISCNGKCVHTHLLQ